MTKIVVFQSETFTGEQKNRLDELGSVDWYEGVPASGEDYLAKVVGADVILSSTSGLRESYPALKDVFVAVPFVGVGFVDLDVLRSNNVTLSNAPGVNRHAVSEWVICMIILLLRDLYPAINRVETYRKDAVTMPPLTRSLADAKVTILGAGNVGQQVAKLLKPFEAEVEFFNKDDDLLKSVSGADIVVNSLSSNPTTLGLLNKEFFANMKKGSYFVSITAEDIIDDDALIAALDSGQLAGAAIDFGNTVLVGDTENPVYVRMMKHPKILATPHIAYSAEKSILVGNDVAIDNIEAWLDGRPQNVVT